MGHILFLTLPYNVYARAYWRTAGYAPGLGLHAEEEDLFFLLETATSPARSQKRFLVNVNVSNNK